ncbi:hypothetical protein AWR36_005670 [Microbulbifer flavimaris]|uniref:MFS transporter n=1 Tax=Microbulbifer flavimaris TaxID=1781068 RepID=A0ABX4I0M2_9GAMM|nr:MULTISPECIES: hypothetical protein [Microbulbifer]KUJ83352.1 hypothetical protein AVO43_05660 [Microbulbifer sp. ZGT114]PCO05507.1 hypothetical protein AWR36_005670 [Microbulbifer flavimaris]
MAEEYRLAWMIYGGGTLVLLAAGWWFMRNWGWSWLRRAILLMVAAALLVPVRTGGVPDAPAMPVLPLFVYQTLFEEGAAPEVTANLVFASVGALALVSVWGLVSLLIGRRRQKQRELEQDPYFNEP